VRLRDRLLIRAVRCLFGSSHLDWDGRNFCSRFRFFNSLDSGCSFMEPYVPHTCIHPSLLPNSIDLFPSQFLFNNLINPPKVIRPPASAEAPAAHPHTPAEEERALLRDEALDETAVLPADLGTSGFDVVPPRQTGNRSRSR